MVYTISLERSNFNDSNEANLDITLQKLNTRIIFPQCFILTYQRSVSMELGGYLKE